MSENHGPTCSCNACAWLTGRTDTRPEAERDDSPNPPEPQED